MYGIKLLARSIDSKIRVLVHFRFSAATIQCVECQVQVLCSPRSRYRWFETPRYPTSIQMLIGTGGIFVFEQVVRKALAKAGIKLPSSLVSMVLAFILLKVCV